MVEMNRLIVGDTKDDGINCKSDGIRYITVSILRNLAFNFLYIAAGLDARLTSTLDAYGGRDIW